jgi:hypothetical protein
MTVRAACVALTILMMPVTALAQPQERQSTAPPAVAPRTLPTPAAAPPAPAEPRAAAREGQPVNVKVELTITDQRGGNPML